MQEKSKYNSIRQTGPESLRHFKRTYLKALRRQISTGVYEPDDPRVIPIKADKQYRSWNTIEHPQVNAAVIYMMDVSGSMTDEQKEIVRTEAFWIDTWLVQPVRGDRNALHHSRRRGQGSRRAHFLSHARKWRHADQLGVQSVRRLIEEQFPPSEWNMYCFQFSDGDNWGEDNEEAFKILGEQLLPVVNLFCYGQVESPYGSGEFLGHLQRQFRRAARRRSCFRRSRTRKRFTNRSRCFWARAAEVSTHGQARHASHESR